jgi:hypothetical protein
LQETRCDEVELWLKVMMMVVVQENKTIVANVPSIHPLNRKDYNHLEFAFFFSPQGEMVNDQGESHVTQGRVVSCSTYGEFPKIARTRNISRFRWCGSMYSL